MTPAQRARLLLKLAELIEANADEIALLESLDNGMPFRMAKFGGVFGAAESLRYHAGWATKLHGSTINLSMPGEWHAFTLREPVGVVGQIVPWNFPFVMGVAKIAPALAVGCTVVLKPAEQTPLTTLRLGELIAEAGFPEGVVNIVTGFGETAGPGAGGARRRGQDRVHRLDQRRQGNPQRLRRQSQAGHAGTGRQVAGDHLSRCQPRAGHRNRGARHFHELRAGMRCRLAAVRAREGLRPGGRGRGQARAQIEARVRVPSPARKSVPWSPTSSASA